MGTPAEGMPQPQAAVSPRRGDASAAGGGESTANGGLSSGDGDGDGIAHAISRNEIYEPGAFTTPTPFCEPLARNPEISTAPSFMASRTSVFLHAGNSAQIRAAIPLTYGAAMDVPSILEYHTVFVPGETVRAAVTFPLRTSA